MASTLPTPSDCCSTCDDIATVQVPGPGGADGADGGAGAAGASPYSLLTAGFTLPAEGATATATVDGDAWMTIGSIVGLQVAPGSTICFLLVTDVTDPTHVVLKNIENTAGGNYLTNPAPGTVFPIGTHVVPSGPEGPTGPTGAGGAPAAATYVLITADGSLPSATVLDTVATGWLYWNTTTNTFSSAGAISLTTAVTGILPIANGGTNAATAAAARTSLGVAKSGANTDITSLGGLTTPITIPQGGTGQVTKPLGFDALSPLTTTGDLLIYSGGTNTRLGIGTAGKVLTSNGTTATWSSASNQIIDWTFAWVQIPQYFSFAIPYDNTIPQIGEGRQILSMNYAASSVANYLMIEALVQCSADGAEPIVLALFDGGADAIAAVAVYQDTAGKPTQVSLKTIFNPVVTTPVNYTLRIGTHSGGAMGINGYGGDGGVIGKLGCGGGTSLMGTWMRIMELVA